MDGHNPYFEDYEQQRRLLERLRIQAPTQVRQAMDFVDDFYGRSLNSARDTPMSRNEVSAAYRQEMLSRSRGGL